ncbi:MAG: hypothetical protein J6D11_01050 [Clostridia bacterium]|nr:hypothetical protein [Clostridia bacterium]
MPNGIFSRIKEKTDTMSIYLPYENVYYEKLADFYRVAKFGAIAVLAIFVLLTTIICRNDLRAENFRYLFKYIDVDPASTSANYKDIYYSAGSSSHFAFYKGDLVLAGDGKLAIYNISGKNILSEELSSVNSVCDADGKYLVAYSPDGKNVSILNSFSKLYDLEYDYPVISASAGDDGSFTVITRDQTYRSAVYVYNSMFKLVYSVRSNEKYAASAAVSPDGKYAAFLSYSPSNGLYARELVVRNISKDKEELSVRTEGKLPIKTGFFEDGNLFLLCSDGISFYDEKFKQTTSVSFGYPIQFYRSFGGHIAVLTGETKAGATLCMFDSEGNKKFTESFPFAVLDVQIIDDKIYLLAPNAVYCYDEKNVARASFEGNVQKMYAFDDGNVMLCYADSTKLLKVSEFVNY